MPRPESVDTPYEDAIIDNLDANVNLGDIYATLQEVLTAAEPNIVSVFIRNMGDAVPVTIVPSDLLQLVRGKDSDTTELSVSVTCSKDDMTFEQLTIPSGVTLTLAGARNIGRELRVTGTGKIILLGEGSRLERPRFESCTATPLQLADGSTVNDGLEVIDATFISCSGTNGILFWPGSGAAEGWRIINPRFFGCTCTGYLIGSTISGGGGLGDGCVIADVAMGTVVAGGGLANGGIDTVLNLGATIRGFQAWGPALNPGKFGLRLGGITDQMGVVLKSIVWD